jgi:uncharacterized protein
VNNDVRNLVSLQDVEQAITGLQKQVKETPVKIQELQAELQRLKQAHEARVVHSHEIAKGRRAHEGEVDLLRTKLSKLKDQLMAVKTNKEYTAMLHEIQAAETTIRSEEDRILELMEEAELLDEELRADKKDLEVQCVGIQAKINELEKKIPELENEIARQRERRSAIEAQVEQEMLLQYRKLSDARKGIALAEVKDELCAACHVRIRPQVYADLKQTDSVHNCDSCSRILFLRERL